ncbi:hypothetical protein [Flavobacterium sp.]|uniref:hypothetical protein n=1 Tax=Flavobacterium sp. TaxID=239 RepID=UPI00391C5475
MYNPKVNEMTINNNTPPSKGKPGGGGGNDGCGGSAGAAWLAKLHKSKTRMVIILLGTIFIVRKSIKKI